MAKCKALMGLAVKDLRLYVRVLPCCIVCSVMFCVCRHGHINAVTMLLNEGSCSPNLTNDDGCTPLHIAAQHGQVYVVELLLTHQELDLVGYPDWVFVCCFPSLCA